LTRRLSNELGEPESLGRMHEIVHSLARSRDVNSERVKLSWVVTGYVLPGSRRDDCPTLQVKKKGRAKGYVKV
jgi:hypothetical protein